MIQIVDVKPEWSIKHYYLFFLKIVFCSPTYLRQQGVTKCANFKILASVFTLIFLACVLNDFFIGFIIYSHTGEIPDYFWKIPFSLPVHIFNLTNTGSLVYEIYHYLKLNGDKINTTQITSPKENITDISITTTDESGIRTDNSVKSK